MMRRSVDLPQPEGPTMHTNWPSGICTSTSSSTGMARPRSAKLLYTWRSSSTSAVQRVTRADVAEQPVPYETVERDDGDDERGQRQEQQRAVAGLERRTIQERADAQHFVDLAAVRDVLGQDERVPGAAPGYDAARHQRRHARRQREPAVDRAARETERAQRLAQVVRHALGPGQQVEQEVPLHAG